MSQAVMARVPALTKSAIWPLLVAPLVAVVYYLALKGAFIYSLNTAVGGTTLDMPFVGFSNIKWGTHWIYHICAEGGSICVAVYVASGIARGRERAAALIAASTISLILFAPFAWFFWLMADPHSLKFSQVEYQEPLYQFVVECAAIVVGPFLVKPISEITRDMNIGSPSGFDGINRLHFMWLWFPLLAYALNLISPMTHFYTINFFGGFGFKTMFAALFLALPLACALIPINVGLGLLSNRSGTKLTPVARNLLGFVVMIGGLAVGSAILYGADFIDVWLFGT